MSDTKFQATIRGWGDKAQQHRAALLLTMTDTRRASLIQNEKHILLIPRKWWPKKTHPTTTGARLVVHDIRRTNFQECRACEKKIGGDLDKDTKAAHNRDCIVCKALNEANTRPKKKQGPAQKARKIKKKKLEGKK